jgi:hypothetical protein
MAYVLNQSFAAWLNPTITSPPDVIEVNTLKSAFKLIDIKDAQYHYMEQVKITTKVYGYKDYKEMALINCGPAYPNQDLTII